MAAFRTLDLVPRFAQNVRSLTFAALSIDGIDVVHHVHERNLPAPRTLGAAFIAYDRRGLH
jgi:hypothetical protein